MKKNTVFMLFLFVSLFFSHNINAYDNLVRNTTELVDKIENAQQDTNIKLADDFKTEFSNVVNINIDHSYIINIDGNNKTLTHKNKKNQDFFKVTFLQDASLSINNLNIKGNYKNDPQSISNEHSRVSAFTFIGSNTNNVSLLKCRFEKIMGNPLTFLSSDNNGFLPVLSIDNVIARENAGKFSSFLYVPNANKDVRINIIDSFFVNNYNTVLFAQEFNGTITVKNTIFRNNKGIKAPNKDYSSGAIVLQNRNPKLIDDGLINLSLINCIFDKNEAGEDYFSNVSRGGAVAIYSVKSKDTINVSGTNFTNNEATNNGGAIYLKTKHYNNNNNNAKINFTNNTFFRNKVINMNYGAISTGGALCIESDYLSSNASKNDSNKEIFKLSFLYNTIVENTIKHTALDNSEKRIVGAGICLNENNNHDDSSFIKKIINGNIILGNEISESSGLVDKSTQYKKNVSLNFSLNNKLVNFKNSSLSHDNNIGVDNGQALASNVNVKNVFNQEKLELLNFCGRRIGQLDHIENIKALIPLSMIEQESLVDNKATALANSINYDQRGLLRSKETPDIGAIENGFVKYDLNGGTWNLEDNLNNNKHFFVSKTNSNFGYVVDALTRDTIVIDNNNFMRPGYRFIGWSLDNNDLKGNVNINDHLVIDEGKTLYAIWESGYSKDNINITFLSNENKMGSKELSNVTINKNKSLSESDAVFEPVELKGFKFIGWCKTMYCTADDIVDTSSIHTKDTVLYAQWEKNDKLNELDSNNVLLNNDQIVLAYYVILVMLLGLLIYRVKEKKI